MKKTLLIVALIASAFVANATIYYFGGTSGNFTSNQINVTSFTAEATAPDSSLVAYDYNFTTSVIASLSISTMPNFTFTYANSAVKLPQIKFYPYSMYTAGKNVVLTISNVVIGDSIIIATQAKGGTGDIWTVTGATTSSNLSISGAPASPAINPVSYIRVLATATTVVLKETNGGFRLFSLNWFNNVVSGVKSNLTDKGISFNGTEISNNKGLSLEVYNVLGKKVASSLTSIATTNFQKGVYIVRVSGSNDSLKICI